MNFILLTTIAVIIRVKFSLFLNKEGLPIHIYHYNELEFAPERVLNHMMQHMLNNDADIDYIFPLDADEFILLSFPWEIEYFFLLLFLKIV